MIIDPVRVVMVNFQTPDLLKTAVESFRAFYPDTSMTIVDNGSKDDSPKVIKSLCEASNGKATAVMFDENIYHGPAMDRSFEAFDEEYIFFLDSDTETRKGGFLELMVEKLAVREKTYAIGKRIMVNKRGFVDDKGRTAALLPAFMLLRRSVYRCFPPFEHHGLPVLRNFLAAQKSGYLLEHFPIDAYVEHHGRGTVSRFGYGLGWRSKIEFILNKLGQ